MKYLVMECHVGYVVLLDEEGRFLRAPNRGYTVGQTLEKPMLLSSPKPHASLSLGIKLTCATIAACLFLFFGITLYQSQFACYSAIHLTINPDVRIELNRGGDVLRVIGLNDDGVDLIEGFDYKNMDRRIVTEELITRAIRMGYLTDGDSVVLDVDSMDEGKQLEYTEELKHRIERAAQDQVAITVLIIGEGDPDHPADSTTQPSDSQSRPFEDTLEPSAQPLTREEIISLALDHAGLTHDQVTVDECDFDREDDGRQIYELEFHTDSTEYDYRLDALTGSILEHKKEARDH